MCLEFAEPAWPMLGSLNDLWANELGEPIGAELVSTAKLFEICVLTELEFKLDEGLACVELLEDVEVSVDVAILMILY